MSAWIISIVGVISLGILLEIILPEGQTTKYVKGAFSLLVVFVIVAPIPAFLKTDWKLDFDSAQYDVDSAFIYETVTGQISAVERDVEDCLLLYGYDAEVAITLEDYSVNKISKIEVAVFLSEAQARNPSEHIELVKGYAAERLNESKSKVYVSAEVQGV
jgi:stage III sporulation protein AF